MDRYFAEGVRKVKADPHGDLVWFTDAQFNEQQAYEQTIRDCIAAAQKAYKEAPEGYSDNEAFEIAINALRSLLDNQDNI